MNAGLTFWLAKRLYGRRAVLAALMIVGTSLEFWYLGKAVITDMTLMFFFNAALTMFCLGFKENNRRFYLPGYFFAGLAVFALVGCSWYYLMYRQHGPESPAAGNEVARVFLWDAGRRSDDR